MSHRLGIRCKAGCPKCEGMRIEEGKVKKGGQNTHPKTPRPSPPQGQGGPATDPTEPSSPSADERAVKLFPYAPAYQAGISRQIREAESAATVKANADSDRAWCNVFGIAGPPVDPDAGGLVVAEALEAEKSAAYERGRRAGQNEIIDHRLNVLASDGGDCTKVGRKHRRLAITPICADCGMRC